MNQRNKRGNKNAEHQRNQIPIEFNVNSIGKVRFENPDKGIWIGSGSETSFKLKYFVEKHNFLNKNNDKNKDFYYIDASTVSDILRTADIMKMLQSDNFNPSGWKISSLGKPFTTEAFETISKIEDMPIGAKLIAIQNEGEWHDFRFTTKRIEINDDVVCLLAHFGNGKTIRLLAK
ncbi:hypothetical protein KMB89_gp07 [Citrobacter phage HCF1]|uniref:Uncharacterized protein n=1 Tax=Citrobacter phage HCF1 TaxID=2849700 RepID=A0ABX6D3I4_9CAUD|nr:hypothetical protein KMB89_gp07 [Citrobacter phage HCF1]